MDICIISRTQNKNDDFGLIVSPDCVTGLIDLSKPPFPREERVYRKIYSIEASSFSSDILKSGLYHDPESSLDGLGRQYNSTSSDLLNNQASLKQKLITIRPAAPWMNKGKGEEDNKTCQN